MERCLYCETELPYNAKFCGACGGVTSAIREMSTSLRGYPDAAQAVMDNGPTRISNLSNPTLRSRPPAQMQGQSWPETEKTTPLPASDDEGGNEEERRRRALFLGLPLLGTIAELQPPSSGAPMVHGTPQLNGVPMIHGNAGLPVGHSQAAGVSGAASSAASSFIPSSPSHSHLPNTGSWPTTHPLHHRPGSGSGTHGGNSPNPKPGPKPKPGLPCGVMALILMIICLLIIGTIGGLFFGLSPALTLVGSHAVTAGGTLHLHGQNFVPGSGISLTLDNTTPLSAAAWNTGNVAAVRKSGSSTLALAGQLVPISVSAPITAGGNGTFDVNIPVSTSWSLGPHSIRAKENISSRSAALNFTITLSAATLVTKPALIDFGKIEHGSKPIMSLAVSNSGTQPLNWTATADQSTWLSFQPATGTIPAGNTPQFIYVTADTSQLQVGVYTTTLHINSKGGNNQVAVTLEVVPASQKPTAKITVSPTTLDFGTLDVGIQLTKAVTISNSGNLALNWKADTGNAQWVKLDTSSQAIQAGALPDTINVTVDTTSLTAGAQTAILNITSNGGNVQVQITVNVKSTQTQQPCTLQAPSASNQTFNANLGANPKPASQSFSVGVSGACGNGVTITPTVRLSSGTGWLAVTPGTATISSGSATFTATVTSAALPVGTYSGSISLAAVSSNTPITGSPQTVGVTLIVTEVPPVLNVSPTSLPFNLSNGDGTTAQSFTISNTGGAPLQWSAALDGKAPQFVTLSGGNGPDLAAGANTSVNVNVNPSGQQAGSYAATVTVSAIDPITGGIVKGSPATVTISITITAQPSMQLSITSLTFSPPSCVYTASGTVTITNTGGGTLGWYVAAPVYAQGQSTGWLSVSPSGQGSGDTTLTFTADGSQLISGQTYTATVTITPSVGSPQTVTVTFTTSYCIQ